jgi:hypothetical protein
MRELLETAKAYDITICLENMPMLEFSLSVPEKILELVNAIDDEHFKICLDTGHVSVFPDLCLAEETRVLGKQIRVLHVHDNHLGEDVHMLPYFGTIDWAGFALMVIQDYETNPNGSGLPFGNAYLIRFQESIRTAVQEYYFSDCGSSRSIGNTSKSGYVLVDNELYKPWNDAYANYNCYAFALGRSDDCYNPGGFSNTFNDYILSNVYSVDIIAACVLSDLLELGNICTTQTSTRPITSQLNYGETAICVRTGMFKNPVMNYRFPDFHFMKLTSEGWLHKPGNYAILKYIGSPSNSRTWTNEYVGSNGPVAPTEGGYTSNIIYIIYSDAHTQTCEYIGNGTIHSHKFTCERCGDCISEECAFSYSYHSTVNGTNYHYYRCNACYYSASSKVACIYLGAGTACTICGHPRGTSTPNPLVSMGDNGAKVLDEEGY